MLLAIACIAAGYLVGRCLAPHIEAERLRGSLTIAEARVEYLEGRLAEKQPKP